MTKIVAVTMVVVMVRLCPRSTEARSSRAKAAVGSPEAGKSQEREAHGQAEAGEGGEQSEPR